MCHCGILVLQVNERPTSFFHSASRGFWMEGRGQIFYPIYHCPWCGGELPNRIPDGVIAPADEHTWIAEKASSVRTAQECLATFGTPDYNQPFPDERGLPTDTQNIEYYGISDWYRLEFYFTGPESRFAIRAKPISLEDPS